MLWLPCLALPAILWKVLEWIWYTFFSTRTANANAPAKDAAKAVETDDKKPLTDANKVSEDKTNDDSNEIAETNATETSTREPSPEKVPQAAQECSPTGGWWTAGVSITCHWQRLPNFVIAIGLLSRAKVIAMKWHMMQGVCLKSKDRRPCWFNENFLRCLARQLALYQLSATLLPCLINFSINQ